MKKFKRVAYNIFLGVLTVAIIVLAIIGMTNGKGLFKSDYDDGIKQIDLNTIFLSGSGVEVHFSDVILGIPGEQRKLIVMEQEGDVETELTDRLINSIDWDFLKKSQKVKYTGKGYFVVDLDKLTKDNIVEDKESKTVTIYINHPRLDDIVIDPNKVMIGDVKQGLLARGDIELTIKDYTEIEKELRKRLQETFNTAENGQAADDIALRMVKEVYAPVIKAINGKYKVEVAFVQ